MASSFLARKLKSVAWVLNGMLDCARLSSGATSTFLKKAEMQMQKIQMGGGAISPAVMKHVQHNTLQLKPADVGSNQSVATQVGGGAINPNVKKHVDASSKVSMGGGIISPTVNKHVAGSSRVSMGGGGVISPTVNKHVAKSSKVSMGGGGTVHPHITKHIQAK